MAAKTAPSHVAPDSGDKSDTLYREVLGKVASTYSVGDACYESASGTWTTQTASAGHLYRTGFVGFRARVSTTDWARKDLDDAYAQYDMVPMILSGRRVIVHGVDLNTTAKKGQFLFNSSSAGCLTPTTAVTDFPRACLAADVADDDTYYLADVGLAMWT